MNRIVATNVGNKECEGQLLRLVYAKAAFPLFRRMSDVNPLVVYYHLVSNKAVPHVDNLYAFRSVSEFERDMDVLIRFFRPASLQDFLRSLDGKQVLPRNSFLLTFDDGLKECYEVVAPILRKYRIPATFFLCSAFVNNKELAYDHKKSLLTYVLKGRKLSPSEEGQVRAQLEGVGVLGTSLSVALLSVDYRRRMVLDSIAELIGVDFSAYLKSVQPYLTSDQVNELLRMGHAIGAHSIDHPRYADLPLVDQVHQTRESLRFVKEQFSPGYSAFAFPSSDARVSKEFYLQASGQGGAEVFFGNHGLLEDCVPRSVQRSSMEKTSLPAEAILGKSYARRIVKKVTGRLVVSRA